MSAAETEPEIRSERLSLRQPTPADAPALARLASDYAVASMTTRMPYPYGAADARAFIEHVRGQDRTRDATFVVEHRDAGVIGALGFHRAGSAPLEMGVLAGPALLGPGPGLGGRARGAGLGRDRLGPADGDGGPFRRQPGLGPGADQGRLPLHRRGAAALLARPRRRGGHAHDGLAGLKPLADRKEHHEVSRPVQDLHPLRRRRRRRCVVPAREVHRVRRAGRRRRRPGRRRVDGGGGRAEHPDRLSLPAAFQGRDRGARHGPQPGRAQRRGRRAEGPRGHPGL